MGNVTSRYRLVVKIAAAALAVGLAAGALSYLSASLQVPGPAATAETDLLRARGAEIYYRFCSWPKFEPNFWPECRNGADEWRARGATRLVEFCTNQVPSRMFGSSDCLSDERPLVALQAGPGWEDAAVAGVVALFAFAILMLFTASRGYLVPSSG